MSVTTTLKNRYKLISTIGKGSIGITYKAEDLHLSRTVCVKIINKELSNDDSFREIFHKETSASIKLIHANINTIYDIDSEDDILFVVSDFAQSGSLRDRLNNKELTPSELIQIIDKVLSALKYIHSKGIVHCGIKPENILFDESGNIKISDIAIANILYPYTENSDGRVDEYIEYLAPEQIHGGRTSPQTDIYSLGIVMFESICGKPPFTAEAQEGVALMHLRQKPVFPQEFADLISRDLLNIILKSLNKKIENRYSSADEIIEELENVNIPAATAREPALLMPPSKARENIENVSLQLQQQETKEIKNESRELMHLKAIAIAFGVILIITALIFLWLYGFNQIGEIATPELSGKKITEAQIIASEKGLSISINKEVYSNKEEGVILEQNPRTGTSIKPGRIIYVTVSKGKTSIEMPDLTNYSRKSAIMKLNTLGIENIKVTEEYSDKHTKGYVIKQMPVPQYMITTLTQITLTVSKGSSNPNRLPDLIGKTEEEAIEILKSLNARLMITARESSTKIKSGCIISQDPPKGTASASGMVVNVTISKGLEGIISPNLVGKSIEEAKKISENIGIRLDYRDDYTNESIITSQSPPAGEILEHPEISVTAGLFTIAPSLVGKKLSEIQDILGSANLHVGEIKYKETASYPENKVMEQEPAEGMEVLEGSAVNIVISKKPQKPGPEATDENTNTEE